MPCLIAKTMICIKQRFRFCSTPFQYLKTPHQNNHFISSSSSSIHYPKQEPEEHITYWPGLDNWRNSPLNHNRLWGPNGPQPIILELSDVNFQENGPNGSGLCSIDLGSCSSLAEMGTMVLSTADPLTKSKLSHLAYSRWSQEGLPVGVCQPPLKPSRPAKPQLVSPRDIPSPKTSGMPLSAYMLHNLAHIELNAIDLAWDTVVRFSPYYELLGDGFFADFARVADDESRHFAWCLQRLSELGFSYGDMPAHNLLWRECDKTSDNVAARLAAIPLVQEARGLDAGPRLVQKLIGYGDLRSSNIVSSIAHEEVAHVAVGLYWFVSVCQKMGRAPCSSFKELLKEYNVELKGPFNYSSRDEAGIPREWYDPSFSFQEVEEEHRTRLSEVVKFDNSSFQEEEEHRTRLSEVYDRLSCIVSMEQENAKLDETGGRVSDGTR